MGRIEIEPEVRGRNLRKHPFPNSGAVSEVLSGGPLVFGEEHRTIFNADTDAVVGGELN